MKVSFKKQHIYLMNLLIQDSITGALKAGNKKVAKAGRRLVNKFQMNASYCELKKRELVIIKAMLDVATKIAEEAEIPENEDAEIYGKQVKTKKENIISMHQLQDILESKITGEKIIKTDLSELKPDFADELEDE